MSCINADCAICPQSGESVSKGVGGVIVGAVSGSDVLFCVSLCFHSLCGDLGNVPHLFEGLEGVPCELGSRGGKFGSGERGE